jgi:hypothetical protein
VAQVVRARHFGYTAALVPRVVRLPSAGCADALPEFLAGRHSAFGALTGRAQVGFGWACCDVFDNEYVRADCFPYGPGPGITRRVTLAAFDVSACWSARPYRRVVLTYDDADGKWKGFIDLRGGRLNLAWECVPDPDPDPVLGPRPTFRLSWSGCDTGSDEATPGCLDPLSVAYVQHEFPHCCDCNQGDPGPVTDAPADLQFAVLANCRHVVFGRHVSYAGGTPVVAKDRKCAWDQVDCYQCGNMTCPLVAELTGSGAPDCAVGQVVPLDFQGGGWAGGFGTVFTVSCANVPGGCAGPNPTPHVRLTVNIVCGATNSGTAAVVIPAPDLEDLDVTIDVPMSDPFPNPGTCCRGVIRVRLMRW